MREPLTKLRPDRDLQCYFFEPTAIAALSRSSASGFTVSGCWRQPFDWAVVEWNRDNVIEHPVLRNLPDGDLSGLRLSYEEVRTNCIPFDSTWYPTVDWPYLRVWADTNGIDTIYQVPLAQYATPLEEYVPATATLELVGTPTVGDFIELAWLDQHFNRPIADGEDLAMAVAALRDMINAHQASGMVTATSDGAGITLTYLGMAGSNGNRVGVYGTVYGRGTESWSPGAALFQGGVTPANWKVELDFGNLKDRNGFVVPTTNVRKVRWTWAADLRAEPFDNTEFSVVVSNWSVSGNQLQYRVAGAGSLRIEDDAVEYEDEWSEERGNYSGGSIRKTTVTGAAVHCTYEAGEPHALYLGTRRVAGAGQVTVMLDANAPQILNLALGGEDVLVRVPIAMALGAGTHTLRIVHTGDPGTAFYFDFLEAAVASTELPEFGAMDTTAMATDWDTYHSLAIAPERTAWLMEKLGFRGRVNHYAGALWFYELRSQGFQYASASITFSGHPEFGKSTELYLGATTIRHVNLQGDTAEDIAKCFEVLVNAGSTQVWANANGNTLTVTARMAGTAANGIVLDANTNSTQLVAQANTGVLIGGSDGKWVTDVTAMPRLNRAARDWHASFFAALQRQQMDVTAAFSMELRDGDDTPAAGIAQRYPDGTPVQLNTPALQTNFGPESTAFWKQVYVEMAEIMAAVGVEPYVQFGEVQWWYFPGASGMPFYDAYTTSTFSSRYGRPIALIPDPNVDPAMHPQECVFLPGLIGEFTDHIMTFVRERVVGTRFEVLYPPDVNDAAFTRIVNLPATSWTPGALACLKTENFTYTGNRNLDEARRSIDLPKQLGFSAGQSSHLIGIGDPTSPWEREHNLARAAGMESVVLFALDQFCLIGYPPVAPHGRSRSRFMGG